MRGADVELRAAAVPADGTWLSLAGLNDLKRNGISRRSRIHAEQANNHNNHNKKTNTKVFFDNPRGFGFSA
jgi:hypothetical protein